MRVLVGNSKSVLNVALGSLLICLAGRAWAHHPMGGATPETIPTGLLSGLAHPLVGLEHLAFLLGLACVLSLSRVPLGGSVATFGLTTLIGSLIHVFGWSLPWPNLLIAASVVGSGVLVIAGSQLHRSIGMGLGAIAGLWHGFAYGEAVVGADPAILTAYLTGVAAVQTGTLVAVNIFLARAAAWFPQGVSLALRLTGFAICVVGSAFAILG